MKVKKWKLSAGVILGAFLLCACGAKEEIEITDDEEIWEEQEEEGKEDASEPMEDEPEEPEPLPDWALAYREFLTERENLLPLLLEAGEGGLTGYIEGFYLYDLNGDNVPELFLHKAWASYYVYTYMDAQVELRNVIYDDAFEEFYFGYDSKDGQAYSVTVDFGTGTDRGMGLAKLELVEETQSAENGMLRDEGRQWLYGASFGGLENYDGTYTDIEWKDAIPNEDNDITTEEFWEIWTRFIPFDYQQVSAENIETYIAANYLEMVPPCSLDVYKNKRDARWDEFGNLGLPCDVEDGKLVVPDTMSIAPDVCGDESVCYYNLDLLTCYNERCLVPDFDEKWKQIYWSWMEDIGWKKDENGELIVDDKENSRFWFCKWEGVEAPVLCIDTAGIPWRYLYFTIKDGNVVKFAESGREAIGYSSIVLINNTDYYFWYWPAYGMPNPWELCNGALYKIGSDQAEAVWEVTWENMDAEMMEEYGYIPEYDAQNPYCEFQGQILPKEEAMAEVDKLLGSGAAAQLLSLCSEESEVVAGPLSFAETSEESYTWEQVIVGLNSQ